MLTLLEATWPDLVEAKSDILVLALKPPRPRTIYNKEVCLPDARGSRLLCDGPPEPCCIKTAVIELAADGLFKLRPANYLVQPLFLGSSVARLDGVWH
jgi:hypothetical protein